MSYMLFPINPIYREELDKMILKMEKTTFVKKAESRILRSEKTPVFYVLTLIYERHLEKPISIGLICSGYER